MTASELVSTLQARGVILEARGHKVAFYPRDSMSPELLRELITRKAEVLELLTGRVEVVCCPGDECDEQIKITDGRGWCPAHRMSITFETGRPS